MCLARRRKESRMQKNPVTERLTREWMNDRLLAEPPAPAKRHVVELDTSDPCCVKLSVDGKTVGTAPGITDVMSAGEFALNVAGVLPGITSQHAQRIRRVVIEVA
jgi:hypothetical protein